MLTELIARTIAPITQLILARILAPEAFGVVATVIMVISFADMLSDAGFQKYLVQKEFSSKQQLHKNADVAFWTSLFIALLLFGLIALFKDQIAVFVGNPGLGSALLVAAIALPLTVIVSTQQALFRRAFEYKKLLPIRTIFAIIPLVVSVPLALGGFDYWSLIIGSLVAAGFNAVAMTMVSNWKPRFRFSFSLLREMFSFSGWTLIESMSIWLTLWSSTFIASSLLTPNELGLYRQPLTIVNSIFALVTNSTTPILFSALSRLQLNRAEFKRFFLNFQFTVAVFILPVGAGAFFYRDFLTDLLFGSQWSDASLMFGLWSLSTSITILFSHYCSETYRALGRPKVSFLSQVIFMAIMIPTLWMAALEGFLAFVVAASMVRLVQIAINQIISQIVVKISFVDVVRNLYQPMLVTGVMAGFAAWFSELAGERIVWASAGIIGCVFIYAMMALLFPRIRIMISQVMTRRSPFKAD